MDALTGTLTPLNSNLIKERFGSYGVNVLVQDSELRIASLFSLVNDQPVTRSLAVVNYQNCDDLQVAVVHQHIVDGGSIGQSFVDHGFAVVKDTTALVELPVDSAFDTLYEMMRLNSPVPLAYHTYQLNVRKDGEWIAYAKVTEVHSPEHLTIDGLVERFGDDAFLGNEDPGTTDVLRKFSGFISQRVRSA
ncbi:MAG: hypothetical protein AB8G18_16115 [Gammaproteobacteria bacterium]